MSNYYWIYLKFPVLIFSSWALTSCLKCCFKLIKRRKDHTIDNLSSELENQCKQQQKNLAIINNYTIKGLVDKHPFESLIDRKDKYLYFDQKTFGLDYLWHNLRLTEEKEYLQQNFYVLDLEQGSKHVLVTIKSGLPKFNTTIEKSKYKINEKEADSNWLYKILLNPYIKFYKTKSSLRFNQNIFLSGNFIYNQKTGLIRCFRVKQISLKNDFSSNFEIISNLIWAAIFGYLLYTTVVDIYKIIQKRLWQNNLIQRCGYFCLQCQINRSNMIAFPCGHISICKQCQVNTKKCPKCQQGIQDFQLIYQV